MGVKSKSKQYLIFRTYSAGCFAGYMKERKGNEVTIEKARRLWYWEGAASLSQIAQDGISKPNKCKFPCEVDELTVLECIEILKVTKKAEKIIKGVPVWQA